MGLLRYNQRWDITADQFHLFKYYPTNIIPHLFSIVGTFQRTTAWGGFTSVGNVYPLCSEWVGVSEWRFTAQEGAWESPSSSRRSWVRTLLAVTAWERHSISVPCALWVPCPPVAGVTIDGIPQPGLFSLSLGTELSLINEILALLKSVAKIPFHRIIEDSQEVI